MKKLQTTLLTMLALSIWSFGINEHTVYAAETVGTVKKLGVYGYGKPPGDSKAAKWVRDDVYFGEQLETVRDGSMQVEFLDETELFLGSSSSMVIDDFVYDPSTGQEKSVIHLGVGVFRVVSGSMSKKDVTYLTPTAAIGIRGTEFIVGVSEDGGSIIAVKEGEVTVSARDGGGGEPITVAVGQVISVSAVGGSITPATLTDIPSDPGITDQGVGKDPSKGGGGGGCGH